MSTEQPKKGTKITNHGVGAANPSRGVTKKEAKRSLDANAKGKKVEPKKLSAAKKKAADHYASEVRNATSKKAWWK
jgi:hypothetical protein